MLTLITHLSPIAAKLYLALHMYPDPATDLPIAQVSLEDLATDTNMSERSCSYALSELTDLKLITRLPKSPHAPSRYQIHAFPNPQPAATHLPDSHPVATHSPSDTQPVATLRSLDSQPAATLKTQNPHSRPKNPQPAPTCSQLNPLAHLRGRSPPRQPHPSQTLHVLPHPRRNHPAHHRRPRHPRPPRRTGAPPTESPFFSRDFV